MTHPFRPPSADFGRDACQALLAADDPDNDGAVTGVCGQRRLHRRHAIPFDQIHGFVPGSSHGEACGVVVLQGESVELCGWSANAAVHDVETRRAPDTVEPGPLFPGPEVDGQPTWLARLEDLPATYEFRYTATQSWKNGPAVSGDESRWVQMRRRLPVPGDQVWVCLSTGRDTQSGRWVTFAEVCEAVTYAFPGLRGLTDPDPSEPEGSVAVAVWRLLTEGTTGA